MLFQFSTATWSVMDFYIYVGCVYVVRTWMSVMTQHHSGMIVCGREERQATKAGVRRQSGADIDCRTRPSLTHMVKCWGICFSLCCALCSPPRRTRGGSNTAATVKKGDNPREIRKNPQR